MFQFLFSRISILLTVCLLLVSLTACSTTLKGTYTARDSLLEQNFTFQEDHRVKMSAFGLGIEGDYRIEGRKITITYKALGLSYDWTNTFKRDGASIFIGDTEFTREK